MSATTVALVVGLAGAVVSFASALVTWRRNNAAVEHEDKSLGLEQLKLALATQDAQIKRLQQETLAQAQRISELEEEVSTLRREVELCHSERDLLRQELTQLKQP